MKIKLIQEFNNFIKKWCGDHYPHLIDSDENEGEFFREKLRRLTAQNVKLLAACNNAYRVIVLGDGKKINWDIVIDELREAIAEGNAK